MTMQNHDHPPEERLAALAGGDPEATGDRALRSHVEGCDRCHDLLAQHGALRAALAELPDLVPSRPLQLVPPVPARPARSGWLTTLRGIAAPVMALGAGLAIIGAVGLGGMAAGGATGGAAPYSAMEDGNSDRGTTEGASNQPGAYGPGSVTPTAAASQQEARDQSNEPPLGDLTDTSTPLPWLVLVIGGAGLVVIGLVLRFSIQARAG